MPRIYTSANDPLDFCNECFPNEGWANVDYNDVGDGPDGRGNCFEYNAEHPPYQGTDYVCHACRRPLGEEDNYT